MNAPGEREALAQLQTSMRRARFMDQLPAEEQDQIKTIIGGRTPEEQEAMEQASNTADSEGADDAADDMETMTR